MDAKRPTPRHIIFKMTKVKVKERILKAAREMQLVTYREAPVRLSADFSKEVMQGRRDWQEIFKVMKSRDLQARLLYPAKKKTKGVHHHQTITIWNVKGT